MTTPEPARDGERTALREVVASALHDHARAKTSVEWRMDSWAEEVANDPDDGAGVRVALLREADAVLDALGLEQVGFRRLNGALHQHAKPFQKKAAGNSHADCEPVYRLTPVDSRPGDDRG